METLPVTWETFVARRRLDIKAWLNSNNIKNYRMLVDHLQINGIRPPSLTSVAKYFKKPKKKAIVSSSEAPSLTNQVENGKEEEPAPLAPAKKKRGRKKVHNKESK